MKTTDQIKTELKDALPVHFHQGDPEPHLTPFNFHALECLHADALAYIQQLETELDTARRAFARQSTEVAEWQLKTLKTVQQIADTFPKWISVEERLPDKNHDWVLIIGRWVPESGWTVPHVAEYREGVWLTNGTGWNKIEDLLIKITHWMPLPEPPEGVNPDG